MFTDLGRPYRTEVSIGAFIPAGAGLGGGDLTLTVTLNKAGWAHPPAVDQ